MILRPNIFALASTLILAVTLAAAPPHIARHPRLVVVISVDQLSESLAKRYESTWPGGLGRLLREGAWFEDAYHDHAFTETGPGHSVLMSGRTPGHTGIIENGWFDRESGHTTYCVADTNVKLLEQKGTGASNRLFLGDTLGDWLQAQVAGSRAFSISGKDRAAILMAGRRPTAVFWFGGPQGFTTSTTYAAALPGWMKTFDADFKQRIHNDDWTWTPLRNYVGESRQQTLIAQDGARIPNGVFPRLVHTVGMPLDESFSERFKASPFLDQVTLEAAEALVSGEHLGHGSGVDLLTLSLSATDYVGHAFGSGSMEMQDNLQRLDRRLGSFLDKLRREVPELWVVLTADHGGLDVPEGLQAVGFPAGRLDGRAWVADLNKRLMAKLQIEKSPIHRESEANQLYLDYKVLEAAKLDPIQVAQTITEILKASPEVQFSATREDLLKAMDPSVSDPLTTSFLTRLRNSFHPQRSGDVLVVFKPMVITRKAEAYHMTVHGSPYDYDRRVPLVFWGPWKGEHRRDPVRIIDLAPTLARELGLASSPDVDGKPLNLKTSNTRSSRR
jgi:predicted AlkP superfamily pyrophosphatase or phosphodiesterase